MYRPTNCAVQGHFFFETPRSLTINWGYQIFVLWDSKGLLHNFEIYTGQIPSSISLPDIGASGNSVLRLIEYLPQNEHKYMIYFDRSYSLPYLHNYQRLVWNHLEQLLRIFHGLEFSTVKKMKKNGRGTFEEKKTVIDGVNIRTIKWLNNRGVSLATTYDSAQSINCRTFWPKA